MEEGDPAFKSIDGQIGIIIFIKAAVDPVGRGDRTKDLQRPPKNHYDIVAAIMAAEGRGVGEIATTTSSLRSGPSSLPPAITPGLCLGSMDQQDWMN
jgi:hypothetical protein